MTGVVEVVDVDVDAGIDAGIDAADTVVGIAVDDVIVVGSCWAGSD
jgi:hypothetical protein